MSGGSQGPHVGNTQFFTPDQLQDAVDKGLITPAVMAQQIAWQTTLSAAALQRGIEQIRARQKEAFKEVDIYKAKFPALNDKTSELCRSAIATAKQVAMDMDLPPTDPRVKRRALREVLGQLDALRIEPEPAKAPMNGAGSESAAPTATADPLAHIPPAMKEHWDRLNYSKERRLQEAKFYIPRNQRRPR